MVKGPEGQRADRKGTVIGGEGCSLQGCYDPLRRGRPIKKSVRDWDEKDYVRRRILSLHPQLHEERISRA